MDREIYLLLVGALIGVVSSLLTSIIQHILSVRIEKIRYDHEKKDKEKESLRNSITQGVATYSDEIARFKRAELRDKLLRGEEVLVTADGKLTDREPAIIVPPGKLACFLDSTEIIVENGKKRIDEIEIGEKVATLDLSEKKMVIAEVIGKMVNKSDGYITVNGVLSLTPTETIYIKVGEVITYINAQDIRLGHIIFHEKGEEKVTSLVYSPATVLVHNISLENKFPFYAGGYLVGGYSIENGVVTKG